MCNWIGSSHRRPFRVLHIRYTHIVHMFYCYVNTQFRRRAARNFKSKPYRTMTRACSADTCRCPFLVPFPHLSFSRSPTKYLRSISSKEDSYHWWRPAKLSTAEALYGELTQAEWPPREPISDRQKVAVRSPSRPRFRPEPFLDRPHAAGSSFGQFSTVAAIPPPILTTAQN